MLTFDPSVMKQHGALLGSFTVDTRFYFLSGNAVVKISETHSVFFLQTINRYPHELREQRLIVSPILILPPLNFRFFTGRVSSFSGVPN